MERRILGTPGRFHGGVNYGFGYGGSGFEGGYWRDGHLFHNTAVVNVGTTHITNVYVRNVTVNNVTVNRVSFNGGSGGIQARPTPAQAAYARETHVPPTENQVRHVTEARSNPALQAKANHGHPTIAATAKPGDFTHGVVAARGAPAHVAAPAAHPAAATHAEPAHRSEPPARTEPPAREAPRAEAHPTPRPAPAERPAPPRPAARPEERPAPAERRAPEPPARPAAARPEPASAAGTRASCSARTSRASGAALTMIQVEHQPANRRFTAVVDGEEAVLDYILAGGVMTITHTGVPKRIEGRGIAGQLMREALNAAGVNGWRVVPACSYAAAYMEKHPGTAYRAGRLLGARHGNMRATSWMRRSTKVFLQATRRPSGAAVS